MYLCSDVKVITAVIVIRCTGQSGMAGQGQRAEGVRYGGCLQPPPQSDGGASKMDEEEPGKSASVTGFSPRKHSFDLSLSGIFGGRNGIRKVPFGISGYYSPISQPTDQVNPINLLKPSCYVMHH